MRRQPLAWQFVHLLFAVLPQCYTIVCLLADLKNIRKYIVMIVTLSSSRQVADIGPVCFCGFGRCPLHHGLSLSLLDFSRSGSGKGAVIISMEPFSHDHALVELPFFRQAPVLKRIFHQCAIS